MGDHRSVSEDSRAHRQQPGKGFVPVDDVIGRAFTVVWPLDRTRLLRSPDTFDQPELDAPDADGGCGRRRLAGDEREVPAMRAMPRFVVRREGGLYAYERALERAGLTPVAGADEAGRGACAGPLVVAAVVLPTGRRGQVPGLADSKLLTPAARDGCTTRWWRRAAACVGGGDPGRGGRPARPARVQRRGDAAGDGPARGHAVVRADRRVPGARPARLPASRCGRATGSARRSPRRRCSPR